MLCASSNNAVCTPAISMIGIKKIASDKIWTNLKTFVQECCKRCLNVTSITVGAQCYVQNAFATLTEELDNEDNEDNDVQTVMTQMAALTTQSQLLTTTAAKTTATVAAAINQLAANQQTMQQQFATFTMQRNTPYQPAQVIQPPITQFLIPNFVSFPTGGRSGGRRGGSGRGRCANFGCTGGRNIHTPFANYVGCGGQGGFAPHWRQRRMRWRCGPFHATTHATQRCSNVLQHHQARCKLECVFFMWI
jgi:hypothetical protein